MIGMVVNFVLARLLALWFSAWAKKHVMRRLTDDAQRSLTWVWTIVFFVYINLAVLVVVAFVQATRP